MIQCNDGKLLMMTSAGKPVCVTSDSAMRLADRGYATVYQPDISQKANAKSVKGSNNNDEDTSADDDVAAAAMNDGITTKMQPSNYTNIAATSNKFAIDFYRQISDTPENIFFSPVSMYLAFSILYEGAGENTAQQIQDVFGFEPDKDARHNSVSHFISSINQDDPHIELNTANALWIADWFEPYDSYTSVARETYLSTAEKVDFLDADDGVKKINQWASDNTNGKIDKVITPDNVDSLTSMVINNAIYFKGTWKTQFPEDDTAESTFWKNSEDSVDVDFMTVLGRFDFGLLDNARMLKMPYDGDRLSMLVILPDDTDGLKQLEDSISHEQIRQWTQNLYNQREVLVSIPKFQIAEKYILNEPLMNLGMPDVFSPDNANLGGIADISSGNNLYVTAAIQDTFIDVNEEGTEAAAVTTIISARESLPPPPPRFNADHPFLFIIQDDESGTILFMGKISDP
jgi:serpin B